MERDYALRSISFCYYSILLNKCERLWLLKGWTLSRQHLSMTLQIKQVVWKATKK